MSDIKQKRIEDWKDWYVKTHPLNIDLNSIAEYWLEQINLAIAEERKRIVDMIENSPKTFGLLDKEGRGGAILVDDIKKLLTNPK